MQLQSVPLSLRSRHSSFPAKEEACSKSKSNTYSLSTHLTNEEVVLVVVLLYSSISNALYIIHTLFSLVYKEEEYTCYVRDEVLTAVLSTTASHVTTYY